MKPKKLLKLIEKYYPGLDQLTDYEILMYSEFKSLHEYQLAVAKRRREIKNFKKQIVSEIYNDNDNDNLIIGGEG